MKKLLFALSTAALAAVPATAAAQQDLRTTIAVLPFEFGGMVAQYSSLGKGLQAFMLNDLAANGKIRVVERDQIQKILDEQKLGASGAVDPSSIVKVGKLLGAKYMITGTFVTTEAKQMQLVIKAFNTETSEIIYTDKSALLSASKFIDLITAATKTANAKLNLPQLAPSAPVPAPAREAAAVTEKNKKMPLETALLYARALEAQDSGKPTEARTLYNKVLTAFPGYEPAVSALEKLPK